MRAIVVNEFGGPDVLRAGQAERPAPGPGELLVRVLAAGVGPWDVALRRGGWSGSLPYIPGGEFAGVVSGGEGRDAGFDDGTPVYGYPGLAGCYADYVTCPIEQLAPIPAALNAVEAAAVPIDGLTAEQGLTDILGAGPGDQVLITAGAGGLGHFAVQIARALGAVVVATASPRHHEFLHRLGATVVVDHTVPGWPDEVRKVTDGGAGKVLACAAQTLDGAARAARAGATIATPVHGPLPGTGEVHWQQYDGAPSGSRLIRMAPWFDSADLSVHLSARYYWQDAAAAHRTVEQGHTQGKIALIVDDDLAAASGV
ncbi:MAG: quinone oxidoreductase family protein [Streptosporangiaceae bacterium]